MPNANDSLAVNNSFTLYKSANKVRIIVADTIADAIKQCPEFTNPIVMEERSAHQWIDGIPYELTTY